MREDIPRNEDVIIGVQTAKVRNHLGNSQRRRVRPGWVITWYLVALLAISAWTLHLLGYLPLPF